MPAGETQNSAPFAAEKLIDLAVILRQTDGDLDRVGELARVFMDEHPRAMAELEFAIRTGDLERANLQARKIKSSLIAIGASSVAGSAARVARAAEEESQTVESAFRILLRRSQELMLLLEYVAAESPSRFIQ